MFLKFIVLFLLIQLISAESSDSDKLKFFKKIGDFRIVDSSKGKSYVKSYYGSQNFKLNWANAFMFCRQFDMQLATLENEQEQRSFLKLLTDTLPASNDFNKAFIGGSNIGSTENWYWVSTGASIKYPINWTDQLSSSGNCMNIFLINETFKLNRAPCDAADSVQPFICEKSNLDKWYIA